MNNKAEYLKGPWVPCAIERGAVGRDSRTVLKDEQRYPFVKDVIRLACLKAKAEDIICLTKPDTMFNPGLGEKILKNPLCYAHRTIMDDGQPTWHPAVDLFCFPKRWWQEHQEEMPDMVMGRDWLWQRVLMELLKKHGAVELPFAVYRQEEEE